MVERRDAVEEGFRRAFSGGIGTVFGKPFPVIRDGGVESGGVARTVGIAESGVGERGGMELAGIGGVDHGVGELPPAVIAFSGGRGEHLAERSPREHLAHPRGGIVDERLVLRRVLVVGGGQRGRYLFEEQPELRLHVFLLGQRERVLELVVGEEVPRETHQGLLVSAARLRIDLLDAGRLLLQGREGGLELVEGIAFLLTAGESGEAEEIIVVDQENFPRIGQCGLEGEFREPCGGSGRRAFTGDFLLPVDRQQGVARQRIERLHTPVGDDRQCAEALEIEAVGRTSRSEHVRGDVNKADCGQQPREVFPSKIGHGAGAVLRRATAFWRCIENTHSRPRETIAQEM